jgi:hypothetical protein
MIPVRIKPIGLFNEKNIPAEERRTMGKRQYPSVDIVNVRERD